jgi:hypothetical protein
MNVTPLMIRPMEMTISNSSNENPRVFLEIIIIFQGRRGDCVEHAFTPWNRVSNMRRNSPRPLARQQSRLARSFIASLVIVRSVGDAVKARRVNTAALAFRCLWWLLMSSIENTSVKRKEA